MLKKTITYKDLDGNPVTEDFYFNLSKAELAEMELSQKGGFESYIRELLAAEDGGAIIGAFKNIITSAVGRRSEDGRRFIKNQEIVDDFLQSDAYSTLFMEFITDETAAARFVRGIVPSDMAEVSPELSQVPEEPKDDRPAYIRENREPTPKELREMSREELQEAFAFKTARSVPTTE
jgi:hypothetical protein